MTDEPGPLPEPASATPRPSRNRGRGVLPLLAVGLLSAALSSAGTAAVVTGLLPASPTASPVATSSGTAVVSRTPTTITDADITAVVARVTPSVVTITATAETRGFFGSGQSRSVGSGIVITANGYILTNRHVVEGATALTVQLENGRQVSATIVRILDSTDLALVKADATGLTPAVIGDSSALKVGQTAIAIGSPLGEYTETVTRGIVSGLDRQVTVTDDYTRRQVTLEGLIQTDAAINPGNSGGPLLDVAGDVVGIDTAVSTSGEGLGFAIPISAAADLIRLARSGASA